MKKRLLIGVSAFALVSSVSMAIPAAALDARQQPTLSSGAIILAQTEPEEEELLKKKKKKNKEAAEEQPAEAQSEDQPRKKKGEKAREQQAEQPANAQGEDQPRKKKREQAQEQQQPAQAEEPETTQEAAPAEDQPRRKKREQAQEQQQQQPAQAEQPVTTQEAAPAVEEPVQQGEGEQPRRKKRDQAQEGEQPAAGETVTQQPAGEQPAAGETVTGQPPAADEAQPTAGGERRKKRREQAGDPEVLPPAEQQKAIEEAQKPATVSPEAAKPKDVVADKPVEEIVKEAEKEPVAVISDQITPAQREELKKADKRRRERVRDNRDELLGAAAVGIAIGAAIPLLGGVVAADEGDRIVVRRGDDYYVRKDDSALFRYDADDVRYERMRGGLVREIITRPNGVQIITVRDAGGYILRRAKVLPNGRRIVLFDARDEQEYFQPYRPPSVPYYEIDIPRDEYVVSARRADRELFYETFEAPPVYRTDQRYTLRDIRENERVRSLVRRVDLDTITFDTGSAFVTESQVALLGDIAGGMLDVLDKDPSAVFLVEGHTDAVGSDVYNMALSDRRAEAVARILSEAYDVPPENMVVQGYGESYLKVDTEGPEKANRRVTLRNITPILQTAQE